MTGRPAPVTASQSLMAFGTTSIRPLLGADFALAERLIRTVPQELFDLPSSAEEFRKWTKELGARAWAVPMTCLEDGEPVGICLMSGSQVKNLHAYLVALFERPEDAGLGLALYLRHAFWSLPLHRLYSQVPLREESLPYAELFLRAGFRREGILVGHLRTAAEPKDSIALGLLREDFDAWCAEHQPGLSMIPPS